MILTIFHFPLKHRAGRPLTNAFNCLAGSKDIEKD